MAFMALASCTHRAPAEPAAPEATPSDSDLDSSPGPGPVVAELEPPAEAEAPLEIGIDTEPGPEPPPEPEPEPEPHTRSAAQRSHPGTGPTSGPTQAALSKEEISRVVRAHLGPVRDCYERGLRHDASLAGRIHVSFTIGPQGKVIETRIQSDHLGDAEVATCLTREISSWTFPAPRGGGIVKISYPFVFESH